MKLLFTQFIICFFLVVSVKAQVDNSRLINQVDMLILEKRFNEALDILNPAIKKSKSDANLYARRSIALKGLKKYDNAINDLLLLDRKLYPNSYSVKNSLAELYLLKGNYNEAIIYADNALLIKSKTASPYVIKAKSYSALNEYENSLDSYSKAIKNKPKDISLLTAKAELMFNLGKYTEVVDVFTKLVQLSPECTEHWYMMAVAYKKTKQYKNSLMALRQIKERDPQETKYDFLAAGIYMKLLKSTKALELYDKILKIKPDYAKAIHNRSICLRNLKRNKEACEGWKKSYKLGVKSSKKYIMRFCEDRFLDVKQRGKSNNKSN